MRICRTNLRDNYAVFLKNGVCSIARIASDSIKAEGTFYLHSSLNLGGWLANILGRITLFSFLFLFCAGSPIIVKLAPFGLPRFNILGGSLIVLSNSLSSEKTKCVIHKIFHSTSFQMRKDMSQMFSQVFAFANVCGPVAPGRS